MMVKLPAFVLLLSFSISTVSTINVNAETQPSVALSANSIYVVWPSHFPACADETYLALAKSTDGGNTFHGRDLLLLDVFGLLENYQPKLAVFENNIFVAWQTPPQLFDNNDIFFKKST